MDVTDIQWFPGHMAKTKKIIDKNLPLVDIVIEILDARAPLSSKNPDIDKIIKNKSKIILLNKSDLADPIINDRWLKYYNNEKLNNVFLINSKSTKSISKINMSVKNILKSKLKNRVCKGISNRPIRAMIVGIPNVGKSCFINNMAHKRKTKVEDRPGVTRGKQWINVSNELEFLDMPGILWPKFEDKSVGEKLAFLGSIKDNILDVEYLAIRLLNFLCRYYNINRYKIDKSLVDFDDPYGLLKYIGKQRGMITIGGSIDLERAAIAILDEFRAGKLGRISLEIPPI